MKVLIADDEPLAVERLSRLVTQMGHEVIATAHHGQDVLNHIENDSPDVVLLDIQMPGMNGLEVLSRSVIFNLVQLLFFVPHMINMHWKRLSFKHRDICKPVAQQDLQQVFNSLTQLTQAQMTGLQQQDDMYDTKTQRHQIAAKTYRGVELIPGKYLLFFGRSKYVTVRHKMAVY